MKCEKHDKGLLITTTILLIVFVVSMINYLPKKEEDKLVLKSESISTSGEEVLDKDSVMDVNIDISDEDWQWLLENATKEEYKSCNITINGETFNNVGIRPKGNSSLTAVANDDTTDRFSLKIDFGQYIEGQTYHGIEKLALNNNIYDTSNMKEYLSYDLFESLGIATPEYAYSNIKLNNSQWGLYLAVEVIDKNFLQKEFGTSEGNLYKPETMGMGGGNMKNGNNGMMPKQQGDMPQLPEGVNKEDIEKNINNGEGMPQQQGNMPQLPEGVNQEDLEKNINNEETMLQQEGNIPQLPEGVNQEGKGENLKNGQGMPNMGKDNGGANLKYSGDSLSDYSTLRESALFKSTTDKEFEKVIDMIKNLNDGTNIENYLDVEEVLKYFAVNTFLVNLDSYSGGMYHNYYLYEKDGVCQIIPWDLNMSFAGFGINEAEKAVNFPIDTPVTGNLEDAPLIGKLLEVDEYKEMYHSYLEKMVSDYANRGVFESKVIKIQNLINDYVKTDPTAFYTYDEYKNSINELITFVNDRTDSIEAQLNGEQPSTEYGTISTNLNLSALGGMNMSKGGNKGQEEKAVDNKEEGQKAPGQNNFKPIDNLKNTNNSFDKKYFIELFAITLISILGIVFTARYKRKRY